MDFAPSTSASTANIKPSVPTETVDVTPTIDTGRFATVDEVGLRGIMDSSLSKATEKNTVWGVKIFKRKTSENVNKTRNLELCPLPPT